MVNRYILHNSLTYLGIGMFIIGLFYSEDLVLRDDTGFIIVHPKISLLDKGLKTGS